ncbi:MAG: T9SS type A sorting domain-containing protein [Candidatus Hatepunaea meridiana]|nr:T9SS type A sorting domain-containing protein [Candidatus Hatepunaea meridiana]
MSHRLVSKRILSAILLCMSILLICNSAQAVIKTDVKDGLRFDPPITTDLLGAETGHLRSGSSFARINEWECLLFQETKGISRAFGAPIPLVNDRKNDKAVSDSGILFAKTWAEEFNFHGCDFTVSSVKHTWKWTIVTIKPEIKGIPVYDANIVLSVNHKGQLASLKAQGFGSDVNGAFVLTGTNAVNIAKREIGKTDSRADAEPIYMPFVDNDDKIKLKAAYRIVMTTSNPALQPTLFIDASNGKIFAAENRVYFDAMQGQTQGYHFPLYHSDDPELIEFPNEWLEVRGVDELYSGDDGAFEIEVDPDEAPFEINTTLTGRWVEAVRYPNENSTAYSFETEEIDDVEITWDDDNSFHDERNLYWHVNFIHSYWTTLEEDFDALDYPMIAGCNLGGEGFEAYEDNAFASELGLFFGRGNQLDNFALYADVVWHEYSHMVTAEVYDDFGGMLAGEAGAMNEAWSDYFPCSISDEPLIGEGGLMREYADYMRNLDNDLIYPDSITGEVHDDGRIIGAAMWHTREVFGADYSDSLFHFSKYLRARRFKSYFQDVLLTDDDDGDLTNGAPNYRGIFEQFKRHGIDLGDYPHFNFRRLEIADDNHNGADGNSNGLWEPDETIRIDLEFFRSGCMEFPAEEDVVVSVTCDNQYVELNEQSRNLGEVQVGDVVNLDQPLLFTISEDAELSDAVLHITISSDDDTLPGVDSLNIVIGFPNLFIVRDGEEERDYSEYYREGLDEIGVFYAEHGVCLFEQTLAEQLGMFESVIWFTGDDQEGVLDSDERDALTEYLNDGGNLILTGQTAGTAEGAEPFFNEMLMAHNVIDSLRQREVQGVEGDIIGDSLWCLLIGGGGAANQDRPGGVRAIMPAAECFYWNRMEETPGAGVRYQNDETGAKSVYLSFGLESVNDASRSNSRGEVLQRILTSFESDWSAAPELTIPLVFQIGNPFPNPFNSYVKLPVSISRSGLITIALYDIRGRAIFTYSQRLNAGTSQIPINALNWSAGKYILKVNSGEEVYFTPVTLVR